MSLGTIRHDDRSLLFTWKQSNAESSILFCLRIIINYLPSLTVIRPTLVITLSSLRLQP